MNRIESNGVSLDFLSTISSDKKTIIIDPVLDFNFEEKIYGMDLEVIPLYKLRSEKKFKNVEELKKQIKIDIKFASKYLIENGLK